MTLLKRPFILLILICSSLVISCSDQPQINPDVEAIALEADITRFDLKFGAVSESELPQLKAEFPNLFPQQYPDSFWVAKKQDTLLQALNDEVKAMYPDFIDYTEEITLLFKHAKYYFPNFEPPKVYTVISEVDYKDPILMLGPEMIIGLDNYLVQSIHSIREYRFTFRLI